MQESSFCGILMDTKKTHNRGQQRRKDSKNIEIKSAGKSNVVQPGL